MVLLLSFCLFHFQVGIALADQQTDDQAYEQTASEQAADIGSVKQGEDGKLTVSGEVSREDSTSSANIGMTLNSLSIFASGIMGPMYVLWCPNMPSAWVYAATAGIYITAEVISWAKYKKDTEQTMEAFNNAEIDVQVKALGKAADQTKAAAETASRKSKFAAFAAVGYAAASAMSLIEVYTSWITATPGGKCVGAVGENSPQNNKMLEGFDFKVEKSITHAIKQTDSELNSSLLFDELLRHSQGEIRSITIAEYEKKQKAFSALRPTGLKTSLLLAIDGMKNVIFSNANAQFNQTLEKAGVVIGLAGVAAVMIWPEVILGMTSGTWMRSVADSGITRAAIFGAHAGFATVGSALISKSQTQLDKRSKQFALLAEQLKNMSSVGIKHNDAIGGTDQFDVSQKIIPTKEDPAFSNVNADMCYVDTSNGQTAVDKTCSCKKTKSCKVAKVPTVQYQGFTPPAGYNQALGAIKSTGNSMYTGDYAGASASADGAIGHSAMISGLNKDLQNKLNDKMKDYKKKPINFKKLHNKFSSQFQNAVSKSLSKMKPADAKALMSMATGPSGSDIEKNKKQTATKDTQTKVKTTAAKGANTGASSKKGSKDPFNAMDFNFGEQSKVVDNKNAPAEPEKDYDYRDTKGSQINSSSEVSIFNLITVRYMKTAFPIIFTEESEKE